MGIQQLIQGSANPDLISRAFELAKKAHQGQKRLSGEDYIEHPLRAAEILVGLKLNPQTVAAAILHDVPDDTPVSVDDVEREFGKEISFLVDGVSKLGKIRYPKTERDIKPIDRQITDPIDIQTENLRKVFFAMAQDLRVILIKLADRLDNMRTLQYIPLEKQKRLALETLEIFAPVANRLGIGEIKGNLEDLAFPYLYPKEFEWLLKNVKEKYEERKKYLNKVRPNLIKILVKEKITPIDVHLRAKHYWSLYQKLLRYDMDFEKIYDLVALRVVVSDIETCYRALGIIHKHFKPFPGRIKDYISLPKPSGYKSLHTTVFCTGGKITEIQIRTPEMHDEAEYGIAAHWARQEKVDFKTQREKFAWVNQLKDWQKGISKSKEFLEGLRVDFFKDRIFAFTPRGDVIDLPEGATPVDFAYNVHTEIGNRCAGSKVNGKIMPLSHQLKNWDLVEIMVDKSKKPSRDWLEFVKTEIARSEIKKYLKKESRQKNSKRGLELLNREFQQLQEINFEKLPQANKEELLKVFKYKDMEGLVVAVGEGEISPREIWKALPKEKIELVPTVPKLSPKLGLKIDTAKERIAVTLGGQTGVLINLARCCNPKIGDDIKAYITQNRGASIHKLECENLKRAMKKWPAKVIDATWPTEKEIPFQIRLQIKASDRVGLLKDIAATVSALNINILGYHAGTQLPGEPVVMQMEVEISNLEKLDLLFDHLKQITGMLEVKKIT